MSSSAVNDYLTKQIFIEKNIVTYRSLSRELRIHVNTAKNELAQFHENAPYHSLTSHATYLLCGEVSGSSAAGSSQESYMDYGLGEDPEGKFEVDGDDVQQTKILLVNESDLEDAKLQFRRLNTIHVYSLAPSPLRDAALIRTPTEIVRAADHGKHAKEMAGIVGKIVSSGIEVIHMPKKPRSSRQNVAGPSRVRPGSKQPDAATVTAASEPAITKEETKAGAEKAKERSKATGKLNFFSKVKEKAKEKEKEKDSSKEVPEDKKEKVFFEPTKRGTKRKSEAPAPEQNDDKEVTSAGAVSELHSKRSPSAPPQKDKVRLQKRTVLSEDEDDELPKKSLRKPRKSRASPIDSDMEDLQAMMDIDDDQVVRATREPVVTHSKVDSNGEEDREDKREENKEEGDMRDAADVDDSVLNDSLSLTQKKPRKRREKKVIPVGKNGLKKKRVVKSRSTMDEKGYMVFEDYSEWESVEEGEEESETKPTKGKTKAKRPDKLKQEEEEGESSAPDPVPKLKPTAKGASSKGAKVGKSGAGHKQGKLANFFTAKSKN